MSNQSIIGNEATTLSELIKAAIHNGGAITLRGLDDSTDPPFDVYVMVAVGDKAEAMRRLIKDALALDEATVAGQQ